MEYNTTLTLSQFGKDSCERVEKALHFLQQKKGVLLLDNEDRENEGDLVFAAQHMSVRGMALMIRECSGIICLCLTHEKADSLNLPYMVQNNSSRFQTPFTITIEAKEGVTTGLSASDRIQTIRTAIAEDAVPEDLARPGHIFPLRAHNEGVLARNGHTEGSIDLMKLAGLPPQAVLCELTNEDGTMARQPQVLAFAKKHEFTVLTIEDIIYYRKFVRDHSARVQQDSSVYTG